MVLGPSQSHYNLRLTERAKMTLSRAQNIVMPKKIDFVLFHCKRTFGTGRYLKRRLEICRTLRSFKCALSLSENECGHLDTLHGIRLPFINT